MISHSLFGTKSVVTPAHRAWGFYLADHPAPWCSNPKRTETMAVCGPALTPADCDTAAVTNPDETSFLKQGITTFQNLHFLLEFAFPISTMTINKFESSKLQFAEAEAKSSTLTLGGNWEHTSVWFALPALQRVFTTSRRGGNILVLSKKSCQLNVLSSLCTPDLLLLFFFSIYSFSHLETLCTQTHLKKQTLLLRRDWVVFCLTLEKEMHLWELWQILFREKTIYNWHTKSWVKYMDKNENSTLLKYRWVTFNDTTQLDVNDHLRTVFPTQEYFLSGPEG